MAGCGTGEEAGKRWERAVTPCARSAGRRGAEQGGTETEAAGLADALVWGKEGLSGGQSGEEAREAFQRTVLPQPAANYAFSCC